MNSLNKLTASPQLPPLLATPFSLIPTKLHSQITPIFLNRLLTKQISDGDLDFLENRILCVKVKDMTINFNMSFYNDRLIRSPKTSKIDLQIEASLYDLLSLAARQQDPDTLVFQRRLIMQGDTELGLELKNFLDGLDLESSNSFHLLDSLLQKTLPVYKLLFSKNN